MHHRGGDASSLIAAMLGPTNTGKTHRAITRMLEHESGMIGLPLRLLAREVYDRISAQIGERQVALITGEEKRVPRSPRYWVCTVEAMPMDREVDFLAIDEVQLCAHPQRGHVFTDRLLHARGRKETYFMGAATMDSMIAQLVPTAAIRRHPRLSKLRSTSSLGLGALPPKTAVVAFSADEVYEIAARLRHGRGGAAVVLGALSPRARNAQVAMYQAGEVDFLVATDAIGMGLNMDVDHVAFASLSKFDGTRRRGLRPDEVGQIAGRAGRHTRDGSFGGLKPVDLHPDVRFRVEVHRFSPVRHVVWRNSDLDFSSVEDLTASLGARPRQRVLRPVQEADDTAVLSRLLTREDIRARARGAPMVSLLWRVCQIPDFRKLLVEQHAGLLGELFMQLSAAPHVLDPQFVTKRIDRLDDDVGDIDTLMMRMQFVRTWSYIAYQRDWLSHALVWQERTRAIEDKLSAALHDRLVERFVERKKRTAHHRRGGGRRKKVAGPGPLSGVLKPEGPFAALMGLRSQLKSQAEHAPFEEVDPWLERSVEAQHDAFDIDDEGRIGFEGRQVGRLRPGNDPLRPRVELLEQGSLAGGARARLLRRLRAFGHDVVAELFEPVFAERLRSTARLRAVRYALETQSGVATVKELRQTIHSLSKKEKETLERAQVRVGMRYVYAEASLSPRGLMLRRALMAVSRDAGPMPDTKDVLAFRTREHRSSVPWVALGFPVVGPLAIRADVCERLLRELSQHTPPIEPSMMLQQSLGCDRDDLEDVLLALGYALTADGFIPPASSSRQGRRSGRGSRRGKKRRSRRGRSSKPQRES